MNEMNKCSKIKCSKKNMERLYLMTLALDSRPKQGHKKMQAENVAWESHSHSRECGKM